MRPLRTRKLGVSGIYITVTNNINGAMDTTIANCRQSKYAPKIYDINIPNWPDIFCIALKKPRIPGDDISLI